MKRRLRVYIDTSVIGGCLDAEFKDVSIMLIEMFNRGNLTAVISEITWLELRRAPDDVRSVVEGIPKTSIENVELTEEAATLANAYVSDGVLDKSKIADAQHIAIATVHKVDLIVSWNFKHIVNIDKIRGFNAVNLKMGYPLMEIRSPLEVTVYEE
ncbi:MAG: PIN domain protein [Candidatus Thermoplasmatota archaeon]